MDFLTLFTSLRCTHACAHCLYGCNPEHGEHMSWDVFARSVELASENRIPTLNFFGGEPLLNPLVTDMIRTALEEGFHLMVATNCRPLAAEGLFARFLEATKQHKERIVIFTPRDRFHLKFFDPAGVAASLKAEGYRVEVQYGCDQTVVLSQHNVHERDLLKLNNRGSCCEVSWKDNLGVLPDGSWAVCPASLEAFGTIFTDGLTEIVEFKRGLPLRFAEGCTECLKDFEGFRRQFVAAGAVKDLQTK